MPVGIQFLRLTLIMNSAFSSDSLYDISFGKPNQKWNKLKGKVRSGKARVNSQLLDFSLNLTTYLRSCHRASVVFAALPSPYCTIQYLFV